MTKLLILLMSHAVAFVAGVIVCRNNAVRFQTELSYTKALLTKLKTELDAAKRVI